MVQATANRIQSERSGTLGQAYAGYRLRREITQVATWGHAALAAPVAPAGTISRTGTISRANAWIGATAAVLLAWSISYLMRQPGIDVATPPSPFGNFALEGLLLSLVWLATIAGAGLSLLAGVVTVSWIDGRR
ncbi:MAG: hypothetical protein HY332_24230 [Chloroflexi bacterium]|nr:hypothetical protein [Chloroflexota bacterium]